MKKFVLCLGLLFISTAAKAEENVPVCHQYPSYFLVLRDHTDSVETDIIVKYGKKPHSCVYKVEDGDYEIKDLVANDFAEVRRHYLFVGGGTCPCPIGMEVYDLEKRQKIYDNIYLDQNTPVKIGDDRVAFVAVLGEASRAQCKNYDWMQKMGLNATLVQDAYFSLDDLEHPDKLKSVKTSKPRCVETQ